MPENGRLQVLNMADILPNRFQPRFHFDELKLTELAESIRKYGVIQPIVVRQIGNKYEIIAGERRYKASQIANKSTIPAIIVHLTDKESEEIALLENVQRQELTPIEEAVSYKRILDMGLTQEDLAKKIGKTQSTIANKIRLLNLDDEVQYALLNGKISERHARSLLRIHDKTKQVEMLKRIINERLTVKKTDDEIKKILADNSNNSQIKQIKPTIKSSGPVEMLFQDEKPTPRRAVAVASHDIIRVHPPKEYEDKFNKRKEEGFMDIDKIMREAQDINVPEQNKDISGLMRQEAETPDVFGQGANPVNVSAPAAPITSEPVTEDPVEQNRFINVSATSVKEEPKVNPATQPANNGVSFDSIFNQAPQNLTASNQTANQSNSGTDIASSIQSTINSQGLNEGLSQTNTEPQVSIQEPVMQPVMKNDLGNNPMNNISESVVEPEVQPMMNNGLGNNSMNNISESVVEPAAQPVMNNGIGNNPMNNISEPVAEPAVQPMMNNGIGNNPMNNISEPVAEPEVQPTMNNGLGMTSAGLVAGNPNLNNSPIGNVPDADIIEPTSNIMPSQVQENNVAQANPVSNFREAIKIIRNCANELERLGYIIDVDEIDLGNSYQATFKINKE